MTRKVMENVAETVASDTGLSRDEAQLLAMALTGAAQVAASWWLDTEGPVSQADAVRLLESLLWRGISNFPRHGEHPPDLTRVRCRRTGLCGGRRRLDYRGRHSRDDNRRTRVEVKIGVLHTPREIVVESSQTPAEVEELVAAALKSVDGQLALSDDKGRKVIVPGNLIAYVEIAHADVRRVGFVSG